MNRILSSSLLAITALGLGACSKKETENVLHIYNWSDYMGESIIEKFEAAFDCKVVLDTFDSNEAMYAKLKAGASGYDVIFPSSYQAALMNAEDMLYPIDHLKMPNLRNIDLTFVNQHAIDKNMVYSVPYMTGSTGIAYRPEKLGEGEASWSLFENPAIKGRATLLNDMRETLGAALKYLGYSANTLNPTEVAEAAAVVKKWKTNIAKFENEGYKPGIASGEFVLVHGYSGDIMQVIDETEDEAIVYALPQEGFIIWSDDMAIPADSDNIELAEAFIDFMHDPEIAAENMNYIYYVCPNSPAYKLVDEELLRDETIFIPDSQMDKAEMIRPLGEARSVYQKAWDDVLAN